MSGRHGAWRLMGGCQTREGSFGNVWVCVGFGVINLLWGVAIGKTVKDHDFLTHHDLEKFALLS